MRPALAALADGAEHRLRDVIDAVSTECGLTEEERAEMLPSGATRVVSSRVGWAVTYLTQAGLVQGRGRGIKAITDAGKAALNKFPTAITTADLESYPDFVAFRERSGVKAPTGTSGTSSGKAAADSSVVIITGDQEGDRATPEDLLSQAVQSNRAAMEGAVLSAAIGLAPTAFEDLVVRLLDKMGYAKNNGNALRTVASGDGGIDGIISQDPLGLDRVYVQAKRFSDTPIGRPMVQGFIGAVIGRRGSRGVFITTSRFTQEARAEADNSTIWIELIDGEKLSNLMLNPPHG